jgi:DNA-binding NarL/FixJ family response regulator
MVREGVGDVWGDGHILRALKAGAQGYLLKNTLHSGLLQTIRN